MRFLVKETKGNTKSKPYIYSLEEIELSDGHNDAVESGHARKSDRTIPLANIIKDTRKTMQPDVKLLDESAKADNNKEEQEKAYLSAVENGDMETAGRDEAGEGDVRFSTGDSKKNKRSRKNNESATQGSASGLGQPTPKDAPMANLAAKVVNKSGKKRN